MIYNKQAGYGRLQVDGTPFLGSGKVFIVGDSGTANRDMLSELFGVDPDGDVRFFATIDAAINECTASAGDVIYVMPGHTETVDAATDIVPDVAGISIVGLGQGADRPTITFATAAAAAIPISAASVRLANMSFVCNIASQNHMLDITGADVIIEDCDFIEGSATGLSFITADGDDNDVDRLVIRRCKFYAPTAGNYNAAIELANDFVSVRIQDCEIYGDFDEAGIDIPAAGNAQVDLVIEDCKVTNLQASQHAIQINGTGSTGRIVNTVVTTDDSGTAVDSGGLELFNVLFHDGTDDAVAVPVGNPVVRVAAGVNSKLGTRVTRAAADVFDGTTTALFTVAGGRVLLTHLEGEVTGAAVDATASNTKFVSNPTVGTDADLCAVLDIQSDELGSIYTIVGDVTVALQGGSGGGAAGMSQPIVIPEGTVDLSSAADAGTGGAQGKFELWYIPLDDGATVTAA